jgi:2-keto-3-deoxy-L-rhamnonate aldolase RhmA
MKNPLKAKLKDGKVILGPWIGAYMPEAVLHLSAVGFDFLLYDMEHSVLDRESVAKMIMYQGYQKSCVPLVRIPWNDIWLAKHMLDVGAYGLVIPWVNTREEAVNAVRYCKYPPVGVRGCAPGYAAFQDPEYIETANEETMVIVQIETMTALENLDSILSVKGIDAAMIGPLDLAMSAGWYGKPERWENTRKVMGEVIKACNKHGVAPGMALSEDMVEEAINMGMRCIFAGSPLGWIMAGAKQLIEHVRKAQGY